MLRAIKKKEDLADVDYLDFIGSINGHRLQIKDIALGNYDTAVRNYFIRHDVDLGLEKAIDFSKFEYDNGIRSTYFLLHTAPYFDYSDTLKKWVRYFVEHGHDVGFHNDVITTYHFGEKDIAKTINKPLKFLREDCGVEIIGTSSHGQPCYYNRSYINYEIWKEYDSTKNQGLFDGVPETKVSLSDFGLKYEAYFLNYRYYFSDSGGYSIGIEFDKQKLFERAARESENNIGLEIVNRFNASANGIFQVLVHPGWWEYVEDNIDKDNISVPGSV